jgi:hypothetical protein
LQSLGRGLQPDENPNYIDPLKIFVSISVQIGDETQRIATYGPYNWKNENNEKLFRQNVNPEIHSSYRSNMLVFADHKATWLRMDVPVIWSFDSLDESIMPMINIYTRLQLKENVQTSSWSVAAQLSLASPWEQFPEFKRKFL